MLEEKGIVIAIANSREAQVKVIRSSACAHCASDKVCHSLEGDREMVVIAANLAQAKVGQEVVLALPSKTFLRTAHIADFITHANEFALKADLKKVDISVVMKRVDQIIKTIEPQYSKTMY